MKNQNAQTRKKLITNFEIELEVLVIKVKISNTYTIFFTKFSLVISNTLITKFMNIQQNIVKS